MVSITFRELLLHFFFFLCPQLYCPISRLVVSFVNCFRTRGDNCLSFFILQNIFDYLCICDCSPCHLLLDPLCFKWVTRESVLTDVPAPHDPLTLRLLFLFNGGKYEFLFLWIGVELLPVALESLVGKWSPLAHPNVSDTFHCLFSVRWYWFSGIGILLVLQRHTKHRSVINLHFFSDWFQFQISGYNSKVPNHDLAARSQSAPLSGRES